MYGDQSTPELPSARTGSLLNRLAQITDRRRWPLSIREALAGYSFILPWLIGLAVFTLGPILSVFYFSFTDYPIIGASKWIGLENYRNMFTNDPLFFKSIYNTAFYVGLRVPLFQVVAFAIALLVSRSLPGMNFFKTGIYLPVLMATVAKAVVWRNLLGQAGALNYLLYIFGLPRQNVLASEAMVKPAIVLMTIWIVGPTMIIYLAGLLGIPKSLYEAAEIDGATWGKKLIHVTIPMMTPVILLNLIMDIINSFQVFTHALIITEGGPVNASLFYVLYIYRQAFQYFKMGYASALSVILFIIILFFTLIVLKWSDRWVQYERI
jgi:multiple sugar transport system permease protein